MVFLVKIEFTDNYCYFILAPKVIIYDNACNLHTYALNRDPLFFRYTKFVVDRFHWKNHTGLFLSYRGHFHTLLIYI